MSYNGSMKSYIGAAGIELTKFYKPVSFTSLTIHILGYTKFTKFLIFTVSSIIFIFTTIS